VRTNIVLANIVVTHLNASEPILKVSHAAIKQVDLAPIHHTDTLLILDPTQRIVKRLANRPNIVAQAVVGHKSCTIAAHDKDDDEVE
jgi:hypothetical protein